MNTAARIRRLREKLRTTELDGILVSKAENRRYLSGLLTSAGFLFITATKAVLATDFRYAEHAKQACQDFEVVQIKGKIAEWLPALLLDLGTKALGFEAADMSVAIISEVTKALDHDRNGLRLVPTEWLVEELRAVKDEQERHGLQQSAELADAAFQHLSSRIKPGLTEKEVAWEIERFLREKGSDPTPFHVIVASGPNSAYPHAVPTDREIRAGEPIVIDFGARVDGYCSDITRTLCLGSQDSTFARIYDLVLGAQLTAIATIGVEMTGEQADKLARAVIDQGGYSEAFGHGLGHGVGLEPHEKPRLGPQSADILADDMVFTIEPGIYLPGWGGVRIEDMVAIEKGRVQVLTKSQK